MSLKTTILAAPIEFEENTCTHVKLRYKGHWYYGSAYCHPEDKEFCSKKVGSTIAHMRAMKQALVYERNNAHKEWKILKHAYDNAMQNIPMEERLDCHQDKFLMAVYQAENRYKRYRSYVKDINNSLRTYLSNQDKAITSLKRQRAAKKVKND